MDYPVGIVWLRGTAWASAILLVLWWTLIPCAQDLSPGSLADAVADVQWIPFVERGRPPLWSDVLGNLGLFACYGFVGWRCLAGRPRRLGPVLISAAVLSLTIELVQLTLPARRTSATDLVTDALGAMAGAGLGRFWEARGREGAHSWFEALARGEGTHLLAALFALCLGVWAVLPGSAPPQGVWAQTQSFSSSFRRFPGWDLWLSSSVHPVALGWFFAALVSRSGPGGAAARCGFGILAAVASGLVLETLQLLAPSRRPEIYQALAFGVGAVPGAVTGLCSRPVAIAVALLALGAGLMRFPVGDNPPGATWASLVLGSVLVGGGRLVSGRTAGDQLLADPGNAS
jgi:VanZ family protein